MRKKSKIIILGLTGISLLTITVSYIHDNYLKINLHDNVIEEKNINNDKNDDNIILNVSMNASYKNDDMYEIYDESSVVVIADFVEDQKCIVNKNEPVITQSLFKIKKILKNDTENKLSNDIIVQRRGGVVSLKELIEARDEDFVKKMGISNLSKEQLENGKIKFSMSYGNIDKDLKEHRTRLLMLGYDKTTNVYFLMQNEYGMVSYDDKTNTAFNLSEKKYINYKFLNEKQ